MNSRNATPKPLISSPEELKSALEKNKENLDALLLQLKSIPSIQIRPKAETAIQTATKAVDCQQCANCCKVLEAGITDEETVRLAELNNTSVATFIADHTAIELEHHVRYIKDKPCTFLSGNFCTIYTDRPRACQDFPNLKAENFKFRLRSIFALKDVCPIVFNTLLLLDEELNAHDSLA